MVQFFVCTVGRCCLLWPRVIVVWYFPLKYRQVLRVPSGRVYIPSPLAADKSVLSHHRLNFHGGRNVRTQRPADRRHLWRSYRLRAVFRWATVVKDNNPNPTQSTVSHMTTLRSLRFQPIYRVPRRRWEAGGCAWCRRAPSCLSRGTPLQAGVP